METGELVGVKLLPKRLTGDADSVARFEQEAATVLRLEHPNLVRAIESGFADGCHYLATEHLEGSTLAQ